MIPSPKLCRRGESQRAGGLETEIKGHLAVVLPDIFEGRDLKRALHRAEIWHDNPPVAHRAVEEILAQRLIGRRILEDAAAGNARRLGDACDLSIQAAAATPKTIARREVGKSASSLSAWATLR